MVAGACSEVKALSMITGVGHSSMIRSRAVRPSIRGMLMSDVTTFGFSCLILSKASAVLGDTNHLDVWVDAESFNDY